MFRQGLRETLDRSVPDVVRQIHDTGALNDAGKQALREALRKYVQTLVPAADTPKATGQV